MAGRPISKQAGSHEHVDEHGTPRAVTHTRFIDIGSFGRAAGWELNFRQLDPGPVEILTRPLAGANVTILGMQISRSYHQRGEAPPGEFTFGIPLTGLRDWCARPIDGPGLLDFNRPSGLDCVSEQGFAGVTLSIKENFLHMVSETFQIPVHHHLLHTNSAGMVRRSDAALLLRDTLVRHLDAPPACFDEAQQSQLVVDLLNVLSATSGSEDKSSAPVRSRAVSVAVEYVEEHRSEAITVGDICGDTGVSWRTLDRAFRERFGIGPKRYVMRRRLEGARADLLASRAGVRIGDVANAWGFWHLGQFARDYKRLFGELPSETSRFRTTD